MLIDAFFEFSSIFHAMSNENDVNELLLSFLSY